MGSEIVDSNPVSDEPDELTTDAAVGVAIRMLAAEEFGDAQMLLERVLEVAPAAPDALHYLGVLKHRTGRSHEGIALIIRAIESDGSNPGPWNNLANIYVECGRPDDAMKAYAQCLALAPDFADAHNNLGTIHRTRGEWALAEASYQRAIAARPAFPVAFNNFSKLMLAQGRLREAVVYACRTVVLLPHDPEARRLLGFAYYTLGENDKAAEVFREWLVEEPDSPMALHHLAACTGENVPPRAADAYVRDTFDAFAASFDAKLEVLGYRAPQVLAARVREVCGEPARALDILDAGCGTGLCAPLVRDYAKTLVGIDLSERMLEKANARGGYDRLVAAELVAFITANPAAFDAIISADTLCYFGNLEAFCRAAFAALRPGGRVFFTVEALEPVDGDMPFRLLAHGRYVHAAGYVTRCLAAAGFADVTIVPEELRREGGLPVQGWMVSGHRREGPDVQ